jgi:hypothetical protein
VALNDGTEELYLVQDASMAVDFYSPAVFVGVFDMGSVQAWWDGTIPSLLSPSRVNVEASNDMVHWCRVYPDSATKKISDSSGCIMYTLQNVEFKYLRLHFEARSGIGGTMTALSYMKRRRANNP